MSLTIMFQTTVLFNADRLAVVNSHQQVHVAIFALVDTGVGAKEPRLGHGLRGQVVGDDLCHVSCTHGFSIKMFVLYINCREDP